MIPRFWIYLLLSLMLLFAFGCGDDEGDEALTPTELELATSGTLRVISVFANPVRLVLMPGGGFYEQQTDAVYLVDGNGVKYFWRLENNIFKEVAVGDTFKIRPIRRPPKGFISVQVCTNTHGRANLIDGFWVPELPVCKHIELEKR